MQEEIKEILEDLDKMQKAFEDYKSRNEKTIEYINTH